MWSQNTRIELAIWLKYSSSLLSYDSNEELYFNQIVELVKFRLSTLQREKNIDKKLFLILIVKTIMIQI